MTRLEEIKARVEAATDGPWEWIGKDLETKDYKGPSILEFECETSFGLSGASPNLLAKESDKEFIVHAREDIPYLLDRIKDLEAKLAVANENIKHDEVISVLDTIMVYCGNPDPVKACHSVIHAAKMFKNKLQHQGGSTEKK